MRVIYRGLAVVVALSAVAGWALFTGPDEDTARPIAAPSAVSPSPGPVLSPSASPSAAVPTPAAAVQPGVAPTTGPKGGPTPSLPPGYTPMEALRADPRLPALPERFRVKKTRGYRATLKDRRSGLVVPRLPKPWRAYSSGPYSTRQIIDDGRAFFVTAPVPIAVQREIRDTALLTARWTLNRYPKGARLTWVDSRSLRDGWLLAYRVRYGRRVAMAAVVVAQGDADKPGMAFISLPDRRKRQWGQVARVTAGIRALG